MRNVEIDMFCFWCVKLLCCDFCLNFEKVCIAITKLSKKCKHSQRVLPDFVDNSCKNFWHFPNKSKEMTVYTNNDFLTHKSPKTYTLTLCKGSVELSV